MLNGLLPTTQPWTQNQIMTNTERFTDPSSFDDSEPVSNDERFTEHSHATPEEAGTVTDKDGKELKAGDPGFMEAMAREMGFSYKDLT